VVFRQRRRQAENGLIERPNMYGKPYRVAQAARNHSGDVFRRNFLGFRLTTPNTPFLDIEICTDLLDSVTPALPCLRLERGFCPKNPRLLDMLTGAVSVAVNLSRKWR
ncbi:hypothetical protein, partial [Pseudomonas amygdali]